MDKNHLNILELCLSPDLGGLELYMSRLSSFLDKKSNLSVVVNENGKLRDDLDKKDISYTTLKRKKTILSFISARKLANIIDENKIDIIHIHWTKDIPMVVLAKLFSKRKPKLVQTRHMTMTRFKDDFYHKFLYKNIDTIICVTKQVEEQIKRFIPSDIVPDTIVSYIGANTPEPITDNKKVELKNKYNLKDSFVIGIVGRIEEAKGQYLLIEALEKLKNDKANVKATIVGHSMDEKYLIKLKEDIKNKNLQDYIVFTGFTNEVQNIMQICDCIVLATHKETFGLVLIEAMKTGVCVIGSDHGGPLEIIDDKETGLLFESLNSTNLYEKIKYLYENEEIKNKLAQKGKEKAMVEFDDIRQFEEIYKNLKNL